MAETMQELLAKWDAEARGWRKAADENHDTDPRLAQRCDSNARVIEEHARQLRHVLRTTKIVPPK